MFMCNHNFDCTLENCRFKILQIVKKEKSFEYEKPCIFTLLVFQHKIYFLVRMHMERGPDLNNIVDHLGTCLLDQKRSQNFVSNKYI